MFQSFQSLKVRFFEAVRREAKGNQNEKRFLHNGSWNEISVIIVLHFHFYIEDLHNVIVECSNVMLMFE